MRFPLLLLAFVLAGCTSTSTDLDSAESLDATEPTPQPDYAGLQAVHPFNAPIGFDSLPQTIETKIIYNGGNLDYEFHVTRGAMTNYTVTEPSACAGTVENPTVAVHADFFLELSCAESLPFGPVRIIIEVDGLVDGYLVFHDAVQPTT